MKLEEMQFNDLMTYIHIATCEVKKIDYKSTFVKTRKDKLKESRQISMAMLKNICGEKYSLRKIGSFFGFNHSNVYHAIKRISDLNDTDKKFNSKYLEIYNKLIDTLGIEEEVSPYKFVSIDNLSNRLIEIYNKDKTFERHVEFNRIIKEIKSRN